MICKGRYTRLALLCYQGVKRYYCCDNAVKRQKAYGSSHPESDERFWRGPSSPKSGSPREKCHKRRAKRSNTRYNAPTIGVAGERFAAGVPCLAGDVFICHCSC